MTWFQLISSAVALAATLYYLPAIFSKRYHIPGMGVIVWATTIATAAVAWVGVS